MIPLSEISFSADEFQVGAETIEKDYIINWILNSLARSEIKNEFVFYGGTAIKRMYFREHRFSEDIDLISDKYFSTEKLIEALRCLDFAKENANIILTIPENRIIAQKNRTILYVQYTGYEEIGGSTKEIQIDFNMKARLNGGFGKRYIRQDYSDLKGMKNQLPVMDLNSILSNKFGMLFDITRNEPRDLYDICFLLNKSASFDFDFDLVQKLMKEKYGFRLDYNLIKQFIQIDKFKNKWEIRLGAQMSNVPELKSVINEIHVKLNALFDDIAK